MNIALTFDDGPSEWTPWILDTLAKNKAHATFFVCGHAIPGRKRVLRRMVNDGHEIGNHTMNHPHLKTLSDSRVQAELDQTTELIYVATGEIPSRWRAPYLELDTRVEGLAARLGLAHAGVDTDTVDWRDSDDILYRLEDAHGIVLLHDGIPPDGGMGTSTRAPTVAAVAELLSMSEDTFVTIDELAQVPA